VAFSTARASLLLLSSSSCTGIITPGRTYRQGRRVGCPGVCAWIRAINHALPKDSPGARHPSSCPLYYTILSPSRYPGRFLKSSGKHIGG
jgi:hypothetical protein